MYIYAYFSAYIKIKNNREKSEHKSTPFRNVYNLYSIFKRIFDNLVDKQQFQLGR